MDYDKLKSGFVEYLKTKYKTSRLNPDKFNNLDKDSSIFLYANDFKEYLKKVNSTQGLNLSLNGEVSAGENDSLILNALNEVNSENLKSGNDLLLELMNSFLSDENIKNKIDENGDGSLSDDEINKFFESVGDGSFTFDELTKLFNEITGNNALNNGITPDLGANVGAIASSSPSGGSGGGGGSGGSGGDYTVPTSNGNDNTGDTTTPDTTKSIENMTKDELEAQKNATKNDIQAKQEALNSAKNGDKTDKTEMENTYKEYTEALGEEKTQQLEQKQEEIKAKHQEAKTNISAQISETETGISEQENIINQAQQDMEISKNKISSLESKQSSLEKSLEGTDESKKQEISAQIEEIKAKIQTEKEEQAKIQEKENKAKTEKETLNSKKTELEAELQQEEELEQQELLEAENEVTGDDEELKAKQEAYDKAKQDYETKKTEDIQSAQTELDKAQEELNKIDIQLAKVEYDAKLDKDYPTKDKEEEINANAEGVPDDIKTLLDNKLGSGFCQRVEEVASKLGCSAQDLLAVMSFESGISPSIVNKSSGATGLIQFMPNVAKGLGTSTSALKNMSAVQQMDYVEKYLLSRKQAHIPNKKELNAGDVYTLVFLPAKSGEEVLCERNGKYYGSNKGLDRDKDGKITKTDLYNAAWGAYKNVISKLKGDMKTV